MSAPTHRGILALSLNPAWQKTLRFRSFAFGEVNRADSLLQGVGGKGTNLAKAVKRLGGDVTVAQFAGGHTGDLICARLDSLQIPHETVRVRSRTRVCTTIVDLAGRTMTELIEPSGEVTDAEARKMRRRLVDCVPSFAALAVCGTLPPGFAPDLYAAAVRAAPPQTVVLVDACTEIEPTLAAGPHVLKTNLQELEQLTGGEGVLDAGRRCLDRYPVGCVAVTDGPRPTHLLGRTGAWRYELPDDLVVVNPLGAGDCVAGTFLQRLLDTSADPGQVLRQSPAGAVDALAFALACGCASCLDPLPGLFDPQVAAGLRPRVAVAKLRARQWPALTGSA